MFYSLNYLWNHRLQNVNNLIWFFRMKYIFRRISWEFINNNSTLTNVMMSCFQTSNQIWRGENTISITIQMRWKVCFTLFSCLTMILLQSFTHTIARQLLWYVQTFIVNASLEFGREQNEFPVHFDCDGKICQQNGPQIIDALCRHWRTMNNHITTPTHIFLSCCVIFSFVWRLCATLSVMKILVPIFLFFGKSLHCWELFIVLGFGGVARVLLYLISGVLIITWVTKGWPIGL